MYTPDFFHNIRCLKKKRFLINSFSCTAMQKEPPQLPFSAHKKQVEKRMASVGEVGGFMEGDDR